MNFLNILVLAFLTAACVGTNGQVGDVFGIQDAENTSIGGGCVSAIAIDQSRIKVTYNFPREATMGKINANGVEVASIPTPGIGSITIPNLLEGVEYTFLCYAILNGVPREGIQNATSQTINRLLPKFSGLKQANEITLPVGYVQLEWEAPGAAAPGYAPVTSYFKVSAYRGNEINSDLEILPKTIVQIGQNSVTMGKYGDGFNITYHVEACTINGACDGNNVKKTVSITEYMTPINTRAISAEGVPNSGRSDGGNVYNTVQVNTNWDHTANYGGLVARQLWVKEGTGDFVLNHTQDWFEPYDPGKFVLFDSAIEGHTYHFMIRGIDTAGNIDNNSDVVSYTVPDLTAPTFAGITNVVLGSNNEKDILISFNKSTSDDVVKYRLYYLSIPYGTSEPTDACSSNTNHSFDYTLPTPQNGIYQILFSNGTARKKYSLCLKAVDASGNISQTTAEGKITTLDTTAPEYANKSIALTSSGTTVEPLLLVRFQTSTSTDIKSYELKFTIKNADTSVQIGSPISTIIPDSRCSNGFCSILYNLNGVGSLFGENQKITVEIKACDNAEEIQPDGSKNCSAGAFSDLSNPFVTGDLTGPTDFLAQGLSLISPEHGKIVFNWENPARVGEKFEPSDLSYFKIYKLNPNDGDDGVNSFASLLSRQNETQGAYLISCALDKTCPNTFSIEYLEPYSSPRFVIIAFDQSNNPSPSYSLNVNYVKTIKVKDEVVPTYTSSALSISVADGKITGPYAYDDQNEENVIQYKVFFKSGADFSDHANPSDATTISQYFDSDSYKLANSATSNGLLFNVQTIVSQLAEGNHFYTICAYDASSNRKCIGSSGSFVIADKIAPVITLAEARSTMDTTKLREDIEKKWLLKINVLDYSTPTGLQVSIYQKISSSPVDVIALDGTGGTLLNTIKINENNFETDIISAPANSAGYFHYLIKAFDGTTTVNKSIYLKYSNIITVNPKEDMRPRTLKSGLTTTVAIRGSGFTASSLHGADLDNTVTIGGQNCSDVVYVSETKLLCTVNPVALGYSDQAVEVRNSIGSVGQNKIEVKYDGTLPCVGGGDGSSGNPYVICTVATFNGYLISTTDGFSSEKYFKLGANLDLGATTYTNTNTGSLGTITTAVALNQANAPIKLNGDGFFISNITIGTFPIGSSSALFPVTSGSGSAKIANLFIYNIVNKLNSSNTTATVGALIGKTLLETYFENVGIYKKASDTVPQLKLSSTYGGAFIGDASAKKVGLKNIEADINIEAIAERVGVVAGGDPFITEASGVKIKSTMTYNLTSPGFVGGIIGYVRSNEYCFSSLCLFENIHVDFTLKTQKNSFAEVGSFFGRLSIKDKPLSIKNSSAKFNLINPSSDLASYSVGGIIGGLSNNGSVPPNVDIENTHVYSSNLKVGTVSAIGNKGVGGLIGSYASNNSPTLSITKSSVTNTNITHINKHFIGGLVGSIAGTSTPNVAKTVLKIINSYSQVSVLGNENSGTKIGGLLGYSDLSFTGTTDIEFQNSYTYNCYSNDDNNVGGLTPPLSGYPANKIFTLSVINSYYNSSHASDCLSPNTTSSDGTSYAHTALNTQATFSGFVFDPTVSAIWKMSTLQLGPEFK